MTDLNLKTTAETAMTFGRFRELKEFPPMIRDEDDRRYDLVLFICVFLYQAEWKYLPVDQLHQVWNRYLRYLKRNLLEYEGFYQDIVSGRYRALDDAISDIRHYGFADYRSFDGTQNLFFQLIPRTCSDLERRADKKEWSTIKESMKYLRRRLRTPLRSGQR